MGDGGDRRRGSVAALGYRLPEAWVALFALLLNYPWEFLQVPLFAEMPDLPHWQAVRLCSRAAVGDVGIPLVAFWAAAAVQRSRHWLMRPSAGSWVAYLGTGIAATIVLEGLAMRLGRWQYAAAMPVLPGPGTGLAPLLQWLTLPPLVVFLARGQLRGQQ